MAKSQLHKVALAVLVLTVLASFSTIAFAGDKVKVQGIIKGRAGNTMTLQTSDSSKLVVVLTDSTQVSQVQGVLKARRKDGLRDVALVRVEQLYPFPTEEYEAALHRYPNAREVVWCQEEPQNQGAWYQIRHRLQEALGGRRQVLYAGRAPAAAPATGISKIHENE